MPIQSAPVASSALAAVLPAASRSTALSNSSGARLNSKDTSEKIRKSATDFEALLIAQMLKSAREPGGGMTGDADEQDETNSTVLELGEQQLGQALSSSGGLGIAKMVIAGLTNHANR
jgi:Rod binding domain-containing protein